MHIMNPMRRYTLQNQPLILDLLEWVVEHPRQYDEVIAAWRTSCPQLTVWEDVVDAGLVSVSFNEISGKTVTATAAGVEFLRQHGRGNSSADDK